MHVVTTLLLSERRRAKDALLTNLGLGIRILCVVRQTEGNEADETSRGHGITLRQKCTFRWVPLESDELALDLWIYI